MVALPTLRTGRVVLRPFVVDDGAEVELLAGDPAVARFNLGAPQPYPVGAGAEWIATHASAAARDELIELAIAHAANGALLGAVSLILQLEHARAMLAYWVGRKVWGQGFATEAAGAMIDHGFVALGLERVYAFRLGQNHASGRVLEKLGMVCEGTRRRHLRGRDRELDDVVDYGILRAEWQARRGAVAT